MKELRNKLTILLDLDNTALLYKSNGSFVTHPKLPYLLSRFRVILYSSRPDTEEFAKKWNVPFVWKGDNRVPEADVLIDDDYRRYSSINRFLRAENP